MIYLYLILGMVLVSFAALLAEDLAALAKKIKQSDIAAFRTIFDHFNQPIFRFLQYKLSDNAIAEDISQEVFVKLWENRHNIKENLSLKSYLYTIANNLALNHIRHFKVVLKHQETVFAAETPVADSPHEKLESQEFQNILANAIQQLPEKMRIVFLMSRVEEMSYKEIAERLEISVKTVETHIGKALKQLRKILV